MFNSKFTKKDSVAEEIEKIISERWDDDDEDDDVKRADAELRRMKAKPIEADKKTDPDKEIGKLAKKTPKEVDEAVSAKDVISDIKKTLNDPKERSKIKGEPKKWIGPQKGDYGYPHSAGHGMGSISGPKKEYGSKKESVEVKEDKWTDIADGPWKKSKRTPGQAASAAANAAGKGLKGAQHKLDVAKPKGKLTAADFKKLRKEELEQIDELSKKTLGSYAKKSALDAMKHSEIAGKHDDRNWGKFSKAIDKASKRQKGFNLAIDKLRKEESEQIDELDKKSFLGKIARGNEAHKKGWGQFGKLITHSQRGGDQKEAEKALRNSNRYYNLINGGKKGKTAGGFPKSTHNEELELSEKTLTPAESRKKEEIVKSMKKDKAGLKARYGKRWKEVAYATATKSAKRVAEEVVNESYGDMSHAAKELVLHADNHQHLYHSSHQPIMNNLRKKMKKGEYHPEKAKKLWQYHADRAAQSYAKEHGDGKPWHKMFSTADRKAAASHWEDMHRHELNEAKGPTSDYGLETFATNPTNESTPLNKAKIVAKAALSKIKNEMLGKAGATSEEIDPRIKTSDTLKGRVKTDRDDDVGPKSVARSHKVKFTPGPK